ncbi:hypothetical protein F8279_19835 [Micromonospora sp. AMSO1212t]|uniref:hypothetical protein n=1 Tax=Micromonospora sp. AMSO1212t TaxID=2650565 RepID=UPI00124B4337|nr:hypothetical protein [Micromonospora sp. AMSO1212t]KAB1904860.1 hypothetical protein F8279_19835 [Micromonospora sp. AMSO1212t]
MSERTERSEGREGMPSRHGMSERTERSEGREGMPSRHGMSATIDARADHPVRPGPYRRGGVRS